MEALGPIYRPPSEADSYILQATIGCSWNHCTYCAMYRHKTYRARPVSEVVEHLKQVSEAEGQGVRRLFVADGDALEMDMSHWRPILKAAKLAFPRLGRISAYATARNLLAKTSDELAELRELGLSLLYLGPESGDDRTLKSIAKGATFAEHVQAAAKAHEAKIKQSAIFLTGIAGVERSEEHAVASARLLTEMDPQYVSLLTITVVETTPLMQLEKKGRFRVPGLEQLLEEVRLFIAHSEPTNAVFRSNHASNYLPLSGRLPRDRDKLLALVDAARCGQLALRPESARGL